MASPGLAWEGTQPHFCHGPQVPESPEHGPNLPTPAVGEGRSIPHSALRNVGGCPSPSTSPSPKLCLTCEEGAHAPTVQKPAHFWGYFLVQVPTRGEGHSFIHPSIHPPVHPSIQNMLSEPPEHGALSEARGLGCTPCSHPVVIPAAETDKKLTNKVTSNSNKPWKK